MNGFDRIKFYIRQAVHDVKWKYNETFHPKASQEYVRKFKIADPEKLSSLEAEIKNYSEDHELRRPQLDPRRTMAFQSRPDEHGCNFITAFYYKRQIHKTLAWAKKHGITVFLADYSTPYGLLALETILELKENGTDITIYAAKSRFIKYRKTYRLVKETPIELAFLTARADYYFTSLPAEALLEVIFQSGVHCSEAGLWISQKKIPSYVLKAWEL